MMLNQVVVREGETTRHPTPEFRITSEVKQYLTLAFVVVTPARTTQPL